MFGGDIHGYHVVLLFWELMRSTVEVQHRHFWLYDGVLIFSDLIWSMVELQRDHLEFLEDVLLIYEPTMFGFDKFMLQTSL